MCQNRNGQHAAMETGYHVLQVAAFKPLFHALLLKDILEIDIFNIRFEVKQNK